MAYDVETRGISLRRPFRHPIHLPSSDGVPASTGRDERAGGTAPILVRKGVDHAIRWRTGERLDHLFEQRCDLIEGPQPAIAAPDATLTYRELDSRANQVARYLIGQGIKAGDRVGLMFDKTVDTYVALLAVLKINAAYVPLDAGFPTERIRFILKDAGVKTIVSMSAFRTKLGELEAAQILLDVAAREIAGQARTRLSVAEKGSPVDALCYIIYTSGTTGNPKGVVIEHASICNFVRVAAELYGIRPGDRVYQGMTIAFDFSVEELWVPLIAGATLVPGKPGTSLVGDDLADFLLEQRVTVLCCVPTLLATIEKELPQLRILLVSGEACPHNLMVRWHRPGRTILNAYGPTEATVTASLTELHPDKPVTIGAPLPTYAMVILDPHKDAALGRGELGEIGIAGVGLAAGYLNRDDLTGKKFIRDFLGIPHNPSRRIYRTGDLGRITEGGEVEFHGRIDTQVKIRGYRIELTEIESVLLELPQIAQAAVTTYEPEPGLVELVAYYSLKQGAGELSRRAITDALRSRLPPYMVPAYLEELALIPMTVSNKADHKKLPAPKGPRSAAGGCSSSFAAPRTETQAILAGALAEVLAVERVSVADDFFKELGAHSLLMARFCAKIRRHPALSDVSMRDIYLNPTIERLASQLGATAPAGNVVAMKSEPFRIPSNLEYYGCGALQLLFYLAYGLFGLSVFTAGFEWTYAAIDNAAALYGRIVACLLGTFVLFSAIPIAAKWLLIGRWKEEAIPIWSLRYFRFWLVKTLIQRSPLAAFAGSPLYNVYLRLLGARIGRNTVIMSRFVPVCTDLISIGDATILRKDTILLGYKAQSGYIHTGPITIGDNVFVGEASVLDIDSAMGNDSQLGHSSALLSGQRVPDGKRYHGSPAQETQPNFRFVEARATSRLRRVLYTAYQLIPGLVIYGPVAIMALYHLFPYFHELTSGAQLDYAAPGPALVSLAFEMLLVSVILFVGAQLLGLASVAIVPRLFNAFLDEGKTYPLYGVHHVLQSIVSGASNLPLFHILFGDSSYIVHYVKLIGYRLNKVEQTGSNFGTNHKHDNPFLCDIGSGTMVSDGLSLMNIQMSSTSFRLAKVKIGDRNYLGNDVHYPAEGRTGANCLLGTKVMVPVDGPVRENVGLLGSPCFEIPRAVERDQKFVLSEEARQQRLREKNRHNLATMAIRLLCYWALAFIGLLLGYVAILYYPLHGVLSLMTFAVGVTVLGILGLALLERASLGFKSLKPMTVSIYDRQFWRHERYWKLSATPLYMLFKGTPFKPLLARLMGTRMGRKVFDDGCYFIEKSMTVVGDHATLNEASILQGHSLEEGVFKSDRIEVGSGCTIGCNAFVHYGVTIGDQTVLEADSFLMKGEAPESGTTWRGNPARAVHGVVTQSEHSESDVILLAA